MTPLPPLEPLRAFEAAARTGSFSSAAERLNVTHGAISRQVAKLENWLGLKLFERGARGVALTLDGQRLFHRTSEAFSLIADNIDRWREQRGSAVVRLATIPSLCALWLIPRLTVLETGEPKLRVALHVDAHQNDLEAEGFDLSLRCGRGKIPGRVSVRLFEERLFPIASPALAEAIGKGDAGRLLAYPLIHDSDASGWRAWFGSQDIDYRPRSQDRRFEEYNLVLEAAAHGLGVALSRPPLALEMIGSGRLTAVDERTALNPVAYWLDRPEGSIRPAAAELARRIADAAGMKRSALAEFIGE